MSENIENIETLNKLIDDPENDALKILAALFQLPDEEFEIMKPLVLESLNEVYSDPQIQFQIINSINEAGISISELINQTDEVVNKLFEDNGVDLTDSKKELLKAIFTTLADTLEASPLNGARAITIPVVLCRENAKLPKYATDGSAAMDIYSPDEYTIAPGKTIIIPTGLKVAIPKGYALLIQPRSGLSRKIKLRIPNSPGLIDSDYHEEIGIICENTSPKVIDIDQYEPSDHFELIKEYGSDITIGKGERFAQMRLIEVPKVKWNQVVSLGEYFTEDHGQGFGSTGEK